MKRQRETRGSHLLKIKFHWHRENNTPVYGRTMKENGLGRVIAGLTGGALLLSVAGCQWVGFTNNTAPQISGRVLAADTHQPLAGVQASRALHGAPAHPATPPKGAQLLQPGRPVVTDAQGYFVYPSQSYLTLLKSATWWSLRLSFQARGYVPGQTNFTPAQISGHAADGTPLIDAGDIVLHPVK
jgi:hypothetical protein